MAEKKGLIAKFQKDAAVLAMKATQVFTDEYFIRPFYGEIQVPVIEG